MPTLETRLEEYLNKTLNVSVYTTPWEDADRLPAFLTGRYRFTRTDLLGSELVLLIDEAIDQEPPAIIRKHVGQVQAKSSSMVVYVREQVTAYNRKRLIEQRVPFVIPGNQMFLPELGLDLREYFRTPPPTKRQFRPATQSVLIHMLLQEDAPETTAASLAPVLGYSTMTLSRTFDELESVELAESKAIGRERVLRFRGRRRETWESAQPWLVDPVKARHFIGARRLSPEGLRAGQDALAHYSMITEPRKPVIAINHKQWSLFNDAHPDREPEDRETAIAEIEVWRYAPTEYRVPNFVEPLSLYLSLRRTTDERVEQALDELMEQLPW